MLRKIEKCFKLFKKKNDSSNKYNTLNLKNFLKLSYILWDINTNLYFNDKLFKMHNIIQTFFYEIKKQ